MTTITDRTMLVSVSAGVNSNKFYEVTLDSNGNVTKRWGRVGANGQSSTEMSGQSGYHRAIEAKLSRGYQKVDLIDTTEQRRVTDLAAVAQRRIPTDPSDKHLLTLIARWCAANRHNIEAVSGGHITVSESGAVSTALGAVSAATVARARALLSQITATDAKRHLIESYLTLIPQSVGRTAGWDAKFAEAAEIARQREFLDSLEASLSLAANVRAADAEFRYQITKVGPRSKAFADVKRRFTTSKNTKHTSASMKLTGVYKLTATDPAETDRWKKLADVHGNVRRLWHGTSEHNLISILHRGLIVPPIQGGTFTTTGRMFGDGVYLSDQSTKSLNYSHGFWSGSRVDRCFMFLTDAVLGHELRPRTRTEVTSAVRHSGKYQSIHVKGGTCGVRNNEMIVWEPDQIRLAYICEFSV